MATKYVQLTTNVSAHSKRFIDGGLYCDETVWREGTLDQLIRAARDRHIDDVLAKAREKATSEGASAEELAWFDDASNRFFVQSLCSQVRVEVFDNELPDPPLAEVERLDRVRAIQATIEVLREVRDGAAGTTRMDLDQVLDRLQRRAGNVGSGNAG